LAQFAVLSSSMLLAMNAFLLLCAVPAASGHVRSEQALLPVRASLQHLPRIPATAATTLGAARAPAVQATLRSAIASAPLRSPPHHQETAARRPLPLALPSSRGRATLPPHAAERRANAHPRMVESTKLRKSCKTIAAVTVLVGTLLARAAPALALDIVGDSVALGRPWRTLLFDFLLPARLLRRLRPRMASRGFLFSNSAGKTMLDQLQDELYDLDVRGWQKEGINLITRFGTAGSVLLTVYGVRLLSRIIDAWFEQKRIEAIREEIEETGTYVSPDASDIEKAIDPLTGKPISLNVPKQSPSPEPNVSAMSSPPATANAGRRGPLAWLRAWLANSRNNEDAFWADPVDPIDFVKEFGIYPNGSKVPPSVDQLNDILSRSGGTTDDGDADDPSDETPQHKDDEDNPWGKAPPNVSLLEVQGLRGAPSGLKPLRHKLQKVPVFLVTDAKGAPLEPNARASPMALFPAEAKGLLRRTLQKNASRGARVVTSDLGRALELARQPPKSKASRRWQFLPHKDELILAQKHLEKSDRRTPWQTARGKVGTMLDVIRRKGRRPFRAPNMPAYMIAGLYFKRRFGPDKRPVFLSKRDADAMRAQLQRTEGEAPEVEVSDALDLFAGLAADLESKDKNSALEELRTLEIVPPSESVQFQRQLGKISRSARGGAKVTSPIYDTDALLRAPTPSLLLFYGKGDAYSEHMAPGVQALEEELGVEVRRFDLYSRTPEAQKLLAKLDKGACGGVPFFYNKDTEQYICGATTPDNLRRWALGKPCEPILPPPNIEELTGGSQETNEIRMKLQTGAAGLKTRVADMMKRTQKAAGGEKKKK